MSMREIDSRKSQTPLPLLALGFILVSISGCLNSKLDWSCPERDIRHSDDANTRRGIWSLETGQVLAFVDETLKGGVIYEPHPADCCFWRIGVMVPDISEPGKGRLLCEPFDDGSSHFVVESIRVSDDQLIIRAKNKTHSIDLEINAPPSSESKVMHRLSKEFGSSRICGDDGSSRS